jgi:quinol-cytochrome oxidoreductase complex cytochrome b subunit
VVFLIFYAILRCIPDKLAGVLTLFLAIVMLFFIPLASTSSLSIQGSRFQPVSKLLFWIFLVVCILLTWLGQEPINDVTLEYSGWFVTYYFYYCAVISTALIERLNEELLYDIDTE